MQKYSRMKEAGTREDDPTFIRVQQFMRSVNRIAQLQKLAQTDAEDQQQSQSEQQQVTVNVQNGTDGDISKESFLLQYISLMYRPQANPYLEPHRVKPRQLQVGCLIIHQLAPSKLDNRRNNHHLHSPRTR